MFVVGPCKDAVQSYHDRVRWKCPACSTQIEHNEAAIHPVDGVLYRWSVCRLELIFDAAINKLTVAPLSREESNQNARPID